MFRVNYERRRQYVLWYEYETIAVTYFQNYLYKTGFSLCYYRFFVFRQSGYSRLIGLLLVGC